ncbi:acyltransferase family protein [Patescibacteria group bacterium]|nr:acyltransferase family protein [Patescibacteria group bacterium]
MQKIQRFPNADLIRVLAMIMVIFLHTILNFTIRPDFFATKLYFLLEPIIAISKTCVLLFFMLSGYLVISKNRSLKENTTKTINKIILPLGFFTLLNIAYAFTKFEYSGNNIDIFVIEQLRRMASFPSSPMWFLVVLAFLYLLNPVWQLIFAKTQKPALAQFITSAALIFSLLITIIAFPINKIDLMFNSFTSWTGFVFFYLYGALIKNKWIEINKPKINLLMIVLGISLTIFGDFITMWQKVNAVPFIWDDYTGNYLSIPVTMTAIGLFNLLIKADLHWLKSKLLVYLAGMSFGIYLIHTYVISLFTDIIGFDFNKLGINVYLYNFLNVLLVFSISIIIVTILKKIPKLKAVVGG